MRFRLLEAPALSAKSWKDKPKSALGAESRSKKPEAPAETPTKSNTFVPKTPEEWEEALYNSELDRAFREIACVKWIENNKPGSPLLNLLSSIRSSLRAFEDKVNKAQDNSDAAATPTDTAIAQRELELLTKQTEGVRNKLNSIFTAIFIAIDCKSDLFENVITKLDLKALPQTFYGNLVSLANFVAKDKAFNTENEYLLNLSLYSRLPQEFIYTLNVFDVVHTPSKAVNYYDPKKINVKQLYNGDDIKPAGISKKDPEDFGTIYGVLELWKETSANDNTAKPAKKGSKKSKYEFSSFEEAEEQDLDKDGATITINGEFRFNGKNKKWEPLDK